VNPAELDLTDTARQADLRRDELVSGRDAIQPREFGFMGRRQPRAMGSILEAAVNRSLRRRGQSLVAVGALVGALIGTLLGLVAGDTETGTRVGAEPARGGALAASSPGSQPPASRAAGSGEQRDGNQSSSTQQAESPDRPGKRDAKAHKHREAGHDKPDNRGKDKPGKDKNK
jgi:hypothetical protein